MPILPPRMGLKIMQGDNPTFYRDFAFNKTLDHGTGPSITFTRTGTATYFDASGNLTTATANVPRFDHDPSTLESRGLLIEEGRTNSIRNSQAGGATVGVIGSGGVMPTNWSGQTTTNGVTQEIIGTGTENGFSYIDIKFYGTPTASSSSNVTFESNTQVIASQNQTWTSSAYFKLVSGSTTNTTPRIYVSGRTSAGFQIAADTGFSNLSINSINLTKNEISRTMSDPTVARALSFFNFPYTNGLQIGGTAHGFTLRIAAPQLEQGAFATSYIPTTSAAVSRGADSAVVTPITSFYNQSEGTLFVDGSRYQVASGGQLFGFRDTDINLVSIVYGFATPTQMRFDVLNTTPQAQLSTSTSAVAGTNYKHGAAYAVNDFEYYLNGTRTGIGDKLGTLPSVTTMAIGAGRNTSGATFGQNNGHIRKVAYWPKRLPNARLQAITA